MQAVEKVSYIKEGFVQTPLCTGLIPHLPLHKKAPTIFAKKEDIGIF